jgi:hypothetical protein
MQGSLVRHAWSWAGGSDGGTGWLRQSRCTRIWGLGRESGPQIERRNVFRGAAGAADGVFKCQVAGAGEGDSYATGCRGKRCIGEE